MNRFLIFILGLLLGLFTQALWAHEGEDHGPPALVNARPLLPRVTAHSELFELVGVLEPGRLLIWLDATPSNAPVTGASVEVEGAGANGKAAEVAPGVYELKLPKAPAPGQHPLTFTVQSADDADLLGAPLVVPQADAAAAATADALPRAAWTGPAVWAGAGAAAAAVVMAALGALRRRRPAATGH
ncbi:hypothetical protein [Azohydromonas caseinilytica]|uniref:Uncharacterized protein n=1 Tax=Azohydromonas caseinilytica TaxID=2728836 RepID=A0A848FGT7_9BURK|nr:hypothetical protein [Azohydromonas caseinilytica]NML18356.1 hypothetical protein [Azohydromonas caseinilytica]